MYVLDIVHADYIAEIIFACICISYEMKWIIKSISISFSNVIFINFDWQYITSIFAFLLPQINTEILFSRSYMLLASKFKFNEIILIWIVISINSIFMKSNLIVIISNFISAAILIDFIFIFDDVISGTRAHFDRCNSQ